MSLAPALVWEFSSMTQERGVRQLNWFIVFMTLCQAPLCRATDSCQDVIVFFSHRMQPMSFQAPAEFVLIFILYRNAHVSHTHSFILPVWLHVLQQCCAEHRGSKPCFTFSRFGIPVSTKTTSCWPISFTDILSLKILLGHDRFLPVPFWFMIHIHR